MILFLDTVGSHFDGLSKHSPLGGSELAQIQLAEALANLGHDVRVITQKHIPASDPTTVNGVVYGGPVDPLEVRTIILSRMTPLPKGLRNSKVVVSLTDQGPHDISNCHLLVGVSTWQINRFAHMGTHIPRRVIPPIVEHAPKVDKIPGRYIYAGAAMKGLDATLAGWDRAGRPGKLAVCHGGWGEATQSQINLMFTMDVEYLGNLSPIDVRAEIARSSYFIGARTYPETFCAVAAIAEHSGTVPILFSPYGPTGLDEAINAPVYYKEEDWIGMIKTPPSALMPKDFSARKIAMRWEKIL